MQSVLARARLLLLCLGAAFPLAAQDTVRNLSILHTNDLHAHFLPNDRGLGGFAQLATALRREREHCSACLYLNAGDLVQGTPVSTIFRGRPVFEISNLLGIDAATLGNHEFDYGYAAIPEFLKIARYPVVSANVVDGDGRLVTQPYVMLTAGGMKIAVIGAVMSNLIGVFVTKHDIGPWRVHPSAEAVRRVAREIGNQADLIMLLAHVEDQELDELLHAVPEIPVVIAGHAHGGLEKMKDVDGRIAVELRAYGVELGRLDLRIDIRSHKVLASDWKRIPIDRQIPPAPEVARLVSEWEAKASKIVDVPIGESKRRLAGPELRPIIEAAIREETGSDFAFVNRGNIRDVLPEGPLLARNVWNVLPFDDRIVIGTFKGRDLPPVVTNGRNVDPDKEYTLATTDFTAANQAAANQLGVSGLVFDKEGPLQRDLVINWIKKKRVVE